MKRSSYLGMGSWRRLSALLMALFVLMISCALMAQTSQTSQTSESASGTKTSKNTSEKEIKLNAKPYPYEPTSLVKVERPQVPLPKKAMRLTYILDRPVRYLVRGEHRQAIRNREDLKQIYKSSTIVSYAPVQESDLPPDAWLHKAGDKVTLPKGAQRVLMKVEKAYGSFVKPQLLKETERTHQIMRQAVISYALAPDGRAKDVRAHQPTHPLARASITQMMRMASHMQPVFPDRPIKPTDTWTQKFSYRDGEGSAFMSMDVTNVYTFERWRRCRRTVCAFLRVKQSLKTAARLGTPTHRTDASGSGLGEGWILFDIQKGEVLKSSWKLKSQSSTKAMMLTKSKDKKSTTPLANAEVIVEVETTAERIDAQDP